MGGGNRDRRSGGLVMPAQQRTQSAPLIFLLLDAWLVAINLMGLISGLADGHELLAGLPDGLV